MNRHKASSLNESQTPCCHKKKQKNISQRYQSTLKKNQKIIDNYLMSQKKSNTKDTGGYYIIEKQKLQALKRKNNPQYVIINPNYKYMRRAKTQNRQLEDDYHLELKILKNNVKDLKKQLQRTKQQYILPIMENKSYRQFQLPRILPHKKYSLPKKQSSNKLFYQDGIQRLQTEVEILRNQIKDQKLKKTSYYLKQLKSNRSPNSFFPHMNLSQLKEQNQHLQSKLNQYSKYDPLSSILQKKLRNKKFSKWRKVVNAIRFIVSLKRFSQKLKIKRQCYFKQTVQENIYKQITMVKDYFLKSIIQFSQKLPLQDNESLLIIATDNIKQRQAKIIIIRKYLNILLDQIGQMQFTNTIIKNITEISYYICKHGGTGAISNYFSSEELDLMCINKQTGKIRAEKNLQKCQITTFIWIKLILYNIILKSSKIPQLNLNSIWNSNLYLFGSLIYEMAKNIYVSHINKVPEIYEIGNWKYINFLNSKDKSNTRKQIIPCKSMIINSYLHEKVIKIEQNSSELIKGTISKAYLAEAYQFQNWQCEEKKILSVTNFIHKRICQYHRELQRGLM